MSHRPPTSVGEHHSVKVVVRVRPTLKTDQKDNLWVRVKDNRTLYTINHKNLDETLQYDFETVFGPNSNQLAVFNTSVQPLLRHVLTGQNASVFAYGPTGAGKTHTILGSATDPGITPRCIQRIFSMIEEEKTKALNWKFQTFYSYMEIYQERVIDLLDPSKTDLPIRQGAGTELFVAGLTSKPIGNVQEFEESFDPASKNRTTAATKLNKRSSRSHSILMIKVERCQSVFPYRTMTGKLYIIDLAGSEDNRRTGNQGIRLQESGAINLSLLALGEVVDALNQTSKPQMCQPHIPYRRSKLTRLLQDSLGGSARSLMIVNLSPEEEHYFDTYTTLNFARKTRKVVNTVRTNETTAEKMTPKRRLRQMCSEVEPDPCGPPVKRASLTSTSSSQGASLSYSPLLRNQQRFENDMHERLQLLEERLMDQMSSLNLTAMNCTQNMSLSTTRRSSIYSPPVVDESDNVMVTEVTNPPSLESKATVKLNSSLNNQLEDFMDQHGIDKPKKPICKVYSDGSQDRKNFPLLDITSSPLFLKPTAIRKKGFRSTAAVSKPSIIEKENYPIGENSGPDLQLAQNRKVLRTLNTGSVKELQGLQTVGMKRASIIKDWRNLNGEFTELDDLKKIPGFNARYIRNFMKSNLVKLDDSL